MRKGLKKYLMVAILHKPFSHSINYRMKQYIFVSYKTLKKKDYVLSCTRSCIAFMTYCVYAKP